MRCTLPAARFPVDYESPKNAGLKPTILALTQLKERHPRITWADLATFGAAVAVEASGGELGVLVCVCMCVGCTAFFAVQHFAVACLHPSPSSLHPALPASSPSL